MATLIDPALIRAQLTAEIAAKKAKHDRYPIHWEAKRAIVMREIFELVEQINALPKP